MFTVLVSLAVVMFMPLALAISSIKFRSAQFGSPDIQNPRPQAAKLTGAGQRVVAAQDNAWEALGLFVTALIICQFAGVDFNQLSTPVILFVVARAAHAVFYLMGRGELRFVAFFTSMVALIWMVSLAFIAI